jgi:hypothetical protein
MRKSHPRANPNFAEMAEEDQARREWDWRSKYAPGTLAKIPAEITEIGREAAERRARENPELTPFNTYWLIRDLEFLAAQLLQVEDDWRGWHLNQASALISSLEDVFTRIANAFFWIGFYTGRLRQVTTNLEVSAARAWASFCELRRIANGRAGEFNRASALRTSEDFRQKIVAFSTAMQEIGQSSNKTDRSVDHPPSATMLMEAQSQLSLAPEPPAEGDPEAHVNRPEMIPTDSMQSGSGDAPHQAAIASTIVTNKRDGRADKLIGAMRARSLDAPVSFAELSIELTLEKTSVPTYAYLARRVLEEDGEAFTLETSKKTATVTKKSTTIL